MAEEKLTSRAEDFSEWYNQLVIRADMADYAPVRGCMVVKPYGWALWENITSWLDAEFKKTGHVNAAFPTLIPLSFFEKELGAEWPELLDQLAGNGAALAFQLGEGEPPALLVLAGKDEKQVGKAFALAWRVVEDELTRQGAKGAVKRTTSGGVERVSVGEAVHAARVGPTVLVSNKADALAAAIEHAKTTEE